MNPHQDPFPGSGDAPNEPDPSTSSTSVPPRSAGVPADGGFFGWVRSLNIVRGQDRWIGGVSTGIAARSGLDPVLVRGIFVVLGIFGGIGLLVYGLAWALLPEPDGRIHAQSAGRGSWTSGMTGALVVTLLGLWRPDAPFFGNTGGFGGFLWSLFWIGVAVFAVYWVANSSNRRKHDDGSTPGASYPGTSYGGTNYTDTNYRGTNYSVPAASTGAADTAATAPFSYTPPPTRPAQVPPKQAAPRPSGADVAVFVGGALLLAALVLILDYVDVLALGSDAVTVALATGTVVLGLGVVLLGIRGRTSGGLGFLAAVGIVAAIISSASPANANWVLADSGRWAGTAGSPATGGYTVVAGEGRVDLTGLEDITEDFVVPISTAAGNVGILVPEDVPVEVRSRMALSSTDLVGPLGSDSVGGIWQPGTLRLNEDAAGPKIILDIRGIVSHITVTTTEDALDDTESRREP